jgi:FixJ family two-component response regulator
MSSKATVFLVDDDEAVRHALTLYLKSAGLDVKSFDSAERFLDNIDEDARGVLVLDQRMDGMSGLDLQKVLNARSIVLQIVFITGHGDVATSVRAMKAGAVDFIEKPFRNEQLLKSIRNAFQRERHVHGIQAARADTRKMYESLTQREREVMKYVVQGMPNKKLAETLELSTRTIEVHRARVMLKMQAGSLPELVRTAVLLEAKEP